LLSNFGGSVLGWVNGRSGGNAQKWVDLISNFGGSVLDWINNGKSGGNAQKLVDLVSNFGSTVLGWIDEPSRKGGHTGVQVDLIRLWKTVSGWVDENKGTTNVTQDVQINAVTAWQNVGILAYLGLVGLSSVTSVDAKTPWQDMIAGALQYLGLLGLSADTVINLSRTWNDPIKSMGLDNLRTDVSVGLKVANAGKQLTVSVEGGSGTVAGNVGSSGTVGSVILKALGGIFENGVWQNIPQYAGGTTNAHGSLFMAGEAGPEIVGHVGGRTEVLNKSQLAATMYAAVHSAMQGVRIDAMFYDGSTDGNDGTDYDTMYRAMYDAFTAAMARGDERDVEKVALLRQISEKDFTASVSTADINRSQRYMNRRAGVTVVPVNG
jgi:hypothetical protein